MRLWTGSGKVTWNGQEWSAPTGAKGGAILSMEAIREAVATEAPGLKFVLSGIPSSLLGYCLDEISIAKPCRVWLGFVNEAGALVDEPTRSFAGRLDASAIHADPAAGAGTVTLHMEDEMRRLQIPIVRLLTHEDQQIDFPGDTGLKNMSAAENWKGMWGQRQVGASGSGGEAGDTGRRKMEDA